MTHEFKEILVSYQQAVHKNIPAVIATVVDVDGSSYRRPGVGMLILQNGQATGAVSGGCVEKEVLRQSQSVFENNTPKIMTYNGRYRLGCEGVLYILIEPFVIDVLTIKTIENYLDSRKPFVIKSYYTKKEGQYSIGSVLSFEDDIEIPFSDVFSYDKLKHDSFFHCFDRIVTPCFRLIIIGAEHDAKALCYLASGTGWEVEIVGSEKNSKQLKDFPGAISLINSAPEHLTIDVVDQQTAFVLMTHNFAKDLLYLQAIKETNPVYIGLLGPSKRREKILSAFIEYEPDISDEFLDSIRGPAGLNLGAETPQEIAISILAEILSVVNNQKPIPLQEKKAGIHATHRKKAIDIFSHES